MTDGNRDSNFPIGLLPCTKEDLEEFIYAYNNKTSATVINGWWTPAIENEHMSRLIFKFRDNADDILSFVHVVYREVPIYIQIEEVMRRAKQALNVRDKTRKDVIEKLVGKLAQMMWEQS